MGDVAFGSLGGPTTAGSLFEGRWRHSASSSIFLAPETTAQARTRRIDVSEYHRPRSVRGSGIEST
ncbi:hypothetical protein ACWCQQ_39185 [Streptomyces sp. NPDC002143]